MGVQGCHQQRLKLVGGQGVNRFGCTGVLVVTLVLFRSRVVSAPSRYRPFSPGVPQSCGLSPNTHRNELRHSLGGVSSGPRQGPQEGPSWVGDGAEVESSARFEREQDTEACYRDFNPCAGSLVYRRGRAEAAGREL